MQLRDDAWSIVTFVGTTYFILVLFKLDKKLQGLDFLFQTVIIMTVTGLIIIALFEGLKTALQIIFDKLAFYLSNIREIDKLKKEITVLKTEIEELKKGGKQ